MSGNNIKVCIVGAIVIRVVLMPLCSLGGMPVSDDSQINLRHWSLGPFEQHIRTHDFPLAAGGMESCR